VVITRGEGERGKYAAAVAGDVYRALAPRLRRDQDKYLALKNLRPTPPAENVALGDDEEEDNDASTLADATESRPVIVVGSAAKQADAPKKLIQRTTQSTPRRQPAFPPVVIEYDKKKAATGRDRIVKN